MANTKSAIKRLAITKRRTLRNRQVKSQVRTAVRAFNASLDDTAQAEASLRAAIKAIDKAASKGVVHRNAAARKKSRLTKQLNRMQAQA